MNFLALDVETANAYMSSICQVGIVRFQDGKPVETYSQLINPKDYFDPFNIGLHGIDENMVRNAPTFPQVFEHIQEQVSGQVLVTHTPFDKTSLRQASEHHNTSIVTPGAWLDSARMVRRHWPQFRQYGFGLTNIAQHINLQYQAHDAAEDARAAGEIVLTIMRESGQTLDEWLARAYKEIPNFIAQEGNPDGPHYGENIVFTGTLSMFRPEAAEMATKAGFYVQKGVTQETTMLVVGIQDKDRLAGYEKSSKHRKAEAMAKAGHAIKIITEDDFLALLD